MSICFLPQLTGISGPPNFQNRLIGQFLSRGIEVHHNPEKASGDALLINGGTRRIPSVWRARKRGVKIIQRLNGINWIHKQRFTGIKHFLRSEWNNYLLAFIRSQLADKIIYQSNFSKNWWHQVYGKTKAQETVIYNGVDLNEFSPGGDHARPQDHIRLLMVEGGLGTGNEQGLDNAIQLASTLALNTAEEIELMVVGRVPEELIRSTGKKEGVSIHWAGTVSPEEIPFIDRSAHLLFSADLNAACPNSVIEALACGLPVVTYNTGALVEIVTGDAGRVVPYGSNHWKLEKPAVEPLARAASEILSNQPGFRAGARQRAADAFDLTKIADQYLDVLMTP